jgi:hypothetical protein
MASRQFVVTFSDPLLKELDNAAVERQMQLEDTIVQIVQEALERDRRRARVFAELAHKHNRPERKQAWKKFETSRKRLKRLPESELVREIDAAVAAVRAESQQRAKSEH